MNKILLITAVVVSSSTLVGCGAESDAGSLPSPSGGVESGEQYMAVHGDGEQDASAAYEAFLDDLSPAEDGYFYQDDIFIPSDFGIDAFFDTFVMQQASAGAETTVEGSEIGTTSQGLSRYSSLQSLRNLTFCIRQSGDATSLNATQAAATLKRLNQAAALWQPHTNTTYTNVPEEATQCDGSNTRVTFHVRLMTSTEMTNKPNVAAFAFFPGYARSKRQIAIRASSIADTNGFRGLLLHELGHTLGFVHEQYRDGTTGCGSEDDSGSPLTRYDSSSIMHYLSCNGTGSNTLSTYDERGAQCAYLNNCEWQQMPGSALDVGAGGSGSGSMWIVGENRGLYRYVSSSNSWQQVTGSNGSRITVDINGTPWFVNTSNDIYRWNGSSWTKLTGSAYDIGAGGSTSANAAVWIIGTNRRMYRWNASSNSWDIKSAGSNGSRIAVDSTGKPWIVNTDQNIYVENGNGWLQVDGKANDIAAGSDGSVWIIGNSSRTGGYNIYEFVPSSGGTSPPDWIEVTGAGSNIAVAPSGKPWIVNSSANIYRNRWE